MDIYKETKIKYQDSLVNFKLAFENKISSVQEIDHGMDSIYNVQKSNLQEIDLWRLNLQCTRTWHLKRLKSWCSRKWPLKIDFFDFKKVSTEDWIYNLQDSFNTFQHLVKVHHLKESLGEGETDR